MRPRRCCRVLPSQPSSCSSRCWSPRERGASSRKSFILRENCPSDCDPKTLLAIFLPERRTRGFQDSTRRLSLARTLSPSDRKSGAGNLSGAGNQIGDRRRVSRSRSRNVRRASGAAAIAFVGGLMAWPQVCGAETMESALVKAYQNNPQLNAQRASARVTDEAVPQALSGYRPRVSLTGTLGEQYQDITTRSNNLGINTYVRSHAMTTPYTGGGTITQTLFNGFQTSNRTRAAESQVSSAREGLRVMEQTVLLTGATAYMDVLRDTANLEVQRTNVKVLEETLKQTRDRFNVGEVTRTDVAQAEAQLAAGQSAVGGDAEQFAGRLPANHRHRAGQSRSGLAGRSLFAPGAARRDRYRAGREPQRHRRDVRRRRRLPAGQDQRGRAVSEPEPAGGRAVCELPADLDRPPVEHVCHRPAHDPDLPRRRRILADPPVQGGPRPAAPQSRSGPQPGPAGGGAGVGPAAGGQGPGHRRAVAGRFLRRGAQRRARGGPASASAPPSTC